MTRSTGRPISRRMTTGTPTTACCEQVEVHGTSPSDTWATRVRAPAKTKQTTVRTRRVEAGEGEGEGEGVYLVCGGRFRWARRPGGYEYLCRLARHGEVPGRASASLGRRASNRGSWGGGYPESHARRDIRQAGSGSEHRYTLSRIHQSSE